MGTGRPRHWRIALATDAWFPQINGVVRTLSTVKEELVKMGHEVLVIHPGMFFTVPAPSYPEVRMALFPYPRIAEMLDTFHPDAVHIPVEGPVGCATVLHCLRRQWPFSSSYHTRFGHYFMSKTGLRGDWLVLLQRAFHNSGNAFMVQTASLEKELSAWGFIHIQPWCRGVDTDFFRPYPAPACSYTVLESGNNVNTTTAADNANKHHHQQQLISTHLLERVKHRPVFGYVGRVSSEKNLEAFLQLDLPGTKLVVGGGPQLKEYEVSMCV